MNSSTFKFTLDLRTTQSQVALPVMLGDTARELHISLCDGATPYRIVDGCLAMLVIARPNGAILESFCMIEGNAIIKYKFDQKTAIVEGLHDCQVILVSADGEIAGTAKFSMVVSGRVYNKDDIEITDEDYLVIDAILAKEAERVDAEKDRVLADFNRESNEAVRQANETERRAKEAERQDEEESRRISETTRQEQEDERQYRYEEIGKTLGEVKNYIHIAPRHITSIDTIYDSVDDIPSEAGVYVVKGGTFAALYEYNGSGCEFVCNLQYLGLYLVTSGEKQGLYYCTSASDAYFMPATASSGGGKDASIEISEDGYWVINGEKTEYKAVGEGGGKLYRHDIHIREYWIGLNDIWLTIYNSDPTNYSARAVFTEEDENGEYIYDYTEPLTAEDFAFLPESPVLASGCIDTSGSGSSEYIVTAIEYDPERGIWVYGIYCGDSSIGTVQTDWVWEFEMVGAIADTVTEVGTAGGSGGGSGSSVDAEAILEEAKEYTDTKIEEALSSGGSSGGGKLYRHDIRMIDSYMFGCDIVITVVNTDPTDYSMPEIDEDTLAETEAGHDIRPIMALLPDCEQYPVSGWFDTDGGGFYHTAYAVNPKIPELYAVSTVSDSEGMGEYSEIIRGHLNATEVIDTVTEITL